MFLGGARCGFIWTEPMDRKDTAKVYGKVGPLGSCDKRCVIDYDELYELLNRPGSKLASTSPNTIFHMGACAFLYRRRRLCISAGVSFWRLVNFECDTASAVLN